MKRSLVILTFNEVEGVRAVLPRVPSDCADECLVVDGGSTDGTVEYCQSRGLRVVGQERRGRGEAFRVGAQHTTGDALVFFSPDGNEDPADIAALFEQLDLGVDIAIASRFLPGSRNEEDDQRLPFRKWANQIFSLAANAIWNSGQRVTDTINGFRAVRRSAFETLALRSMAFTIEYEMTIRAMKRRMRIIEIPTVEGKRVAGETKAPSVRTGIAFLNLLLSELLNRPH